MENKYLVIDSEGNLSEPEKFIKSKDCSRDFKILIEREALGISPKAKYKKPEYLKYAQKLGFKWEPNAGIGFLQYDHKGDLIIRLIKEYSRKLINQIGFPIYEVRGSNFFNLDYPVVDAYASLFGDRLFNFKQGNDKLVMSYDSSYPQFNLASSYQIKEDNLPFAHFSISDCYRYEQSGECMLLFRNRRFFMPDLHPYLKNVNEAFKCYFKIEKKLIESSELVNRKYVRLAKVSSKNNWRKYQDKIIQIAIKNSEPLLVEIRCDNIDRYWIIDVDYSIIDSLGQAREIGCIQIDVGNAERLGIKYVNKNGVENNPVIIHSAVPGGIERYLYMLLDNFKESFPLWLSPVQVRLIPVGEKYNQEALNILDKYNENLRIEIDDRAESVSKRIKLAYKDLIPEQIIIGEKEIRNPEIIDKKLNNLAESIKDYPFLKLNWPANVSKQIIA